MGLQADKCASYENQAQNDGAPSDLTLSGECVWSKGAVRRSRQALVSDDPTVVETTDDEQHPRRDAENALDRVRRVERQNEGGSCNGDADPESPEPKR